MSVAYICMACVGMTHIVIAYTAMACVLMTFIGVACIFMAYMVMTCHSMKNQKNSNLNAAWMYRRY